MFGELFECALARVNYEEIAAALIAAPADAATTPKGPNA